VVVREPAGDDDVALAGAAGDRRGTGVALQPAGVVELGDLFTDLTGDPAASRYPSPGMLT
jgi:hypothetical protein